MLLTIEELFTISYTIVDDWFQAEGQYLLNRTVGAKPTFSDSEMLTVMLGIDFFEFTSERRYLRFIRGNYLYLFPDLIDQSQFNRRSRGLRNLLNSLREYWLRALDVQFEDHFIIDTTPVIAVGYRRDKSKSAFLGSADYGVCAARKMKYFGYKLVLLSTIDGIPYSFELVPANTDERDAADEILDTLPPHKCNVWSDKGFIGELWQALWSQKNIFIWTTKRKNQQQNPKCFDQLMNRIRLRIETVNDQLKEGGRSVEKTLAKTVLGTCTRVLTKITCLTFRIYLDTFFSINVLNYSFDK